MMTSEVWAGSKRIPTISCESQRVERLVSQTSVGAKKPCRAAERHFTAKVRCRLVKESSRQLPMEPTNTLLAEPLPVADVLDLGIAERWGKIHPLPKQAAGAAWLPVLQTKEWFAVPKNEE